MAASKLVHLNGSSWVIPGPTNIGYVEKDGGVYLIDSGNDKEAGRKINKLLSERRSTLLGIINTHSNADHIGANDYFQRLTNCKVYATQAEKAFIESPQIEASSLWGGFTVNELKNKFFEAKPSFVTDVIQSNTTILDDIEVIDLPGHFFQMVGFATKDKVAYLGDAMFGERILEKYKIPYIYDVKKYRQTIENIKEIDAKYYVVSHGEIVSEIESLADKNLRKVDEIETDILAALSRELTFEEILQAICNKLEIKLNAAQYALIGSTIRSFLSYLNSENKIAYGFVDSRMYWKTL